MMLSFSVAFPAIDPVIFSFGPLQLRWYSLAYIAGIAIVWAYMRKIMDRGRDIWGPLGAPATPAHIDAFVLWAMIGVILGGRLGYVLFYSPFYYWQNPVEIFMTWKGGMSFHGGLLGVILATFLFCRQYNIAKFSFTDALVVTIPCGLFLGRIANFINGELYGRPSDLPWAVRFPSQTGEEWIARHPSQLYEAGLEGILLLAILLWLVHWRRILWRPGFCCGMFLILYGACRLLAEFFRAPDAHIGYLSPILGGITLGMILSLPMIAAGVLLVYLGQKTKLPTS